MCALLTETSSMTGETVSHYRIIEKIGYGGMGEVFFADNTLLQCKVTLKFLRIGMEKDAPPLRSGRTWTPVKD